MGEGSSAPCQEPGTILFASLLRKRGPFQRNCPVTLCFIFEETGTQRQSHSPQITRLCQWGCWGSSWSPADPREPFQILLLPPQEINCSKEGYRLQWGEKEVMWNKTKLENRMLGLHPLSPPCSFVVSSKAGMSKRSTSSHLSVRTGPYITSMGSSWLSEQED